MSDELQQKGTGIVQNRSPLFGKEETPTDKMDSQIEKQETDELLDVLDHFLETTEADMFEDLGEILVHKLKKPRSPKDAELLEKRSADNPPEQDEIGKLFGGGHYMLSLKIYQYNGTRKVVKHWKRKYFTCASSYDKYLKTNQIAEMMDFKQMVNIANNNEGTMNNPMIEMFSKQNENFMQMMIGMMTKAQAPQPQLNLGEMMTAFATLMTAMKGDNSNSKFMETLLLNSMNQNNSQPSMLDMMAQFGEFQKMFGNNPAEEKPEGIAEMIVPMIPEIVGKLEPLLGAMASSKALVKSKLKPYEPQLNEIRRNPKVRGLLKDEMSKMYTPEQMKLIADRANVPLDDEPKAVKAPIVDAGKVLIT